MDENTWSTSSSRMVSGNFYLSSDVSEYGVTVTLFTDEIELRENYRKILSYMLANLMIQSKAKRTVIIAMKTLFSTTKNDYATAMAAIILSATPIIVLFVALQKQFIKGMTIGAVKG